MSWTKGVKQQVVQCVRMNSFIHIFSHKKVSGWKNRSSTPNVVFTRGYGTNCFSSMILCACCLHHCLNNSLGARVPGRDLFRPSLPPGFKDCCRVVAPFRMWLCVAKREGRRLRRALIQTRLLSTSWFEP